MVNPARLPRFNAVRALVVGDVMLDRYWSGPTSRVSPEAPVPVVRVEQSEDRPGGAANVAVNMVHLGVDVTLWGLVGEDEAGQGLTHQLQDQGVDCRLQVVADMPTTTKLRVLSRHQQLIRLDFELGHGGAPRAGARPAPDTQLLESVDIVVVSDYAKGSVESIGELIQTARARGVPVVVDPKGEGFERYDGASVLTPNRAELERAAGPCNDDAALAERAQALRASLALEAVLVTLGERGMLLVAEGQAPRHLPTRAREVFDVTGAGDTVVATLAAAMGAGEPVEGAALLANLAAGLAVGKLGTASVSVAELGRALREEQGPWDSILSEAEAVTAVREAHAHGEGVVMTNGCFDLLHEGHVAYLEEARQLGDRLLVAVNADASVARLKGSGRPVVPLEQRMAVLAGLASVDWVVAFHEDTPQRLICELRPDILVKGGDYRAEEVAGARCVEAHGGRVAILAYREGRSTSDVIRAICQDR